MGGGFYFTSARDARAEDEGYYTKSRDDIFTQSREREIHATMDPKQALVREARDSEDHPRSLPIILGLDFTGSMGHIPHKLIQDGLPTLMGGIIDAGLVDAQLLFLGLGDHEVDDAPLQVGQFESSDELIDQWLTRSWIEGGGGANAGESYLLAWYFAALHTQTDAWEKRNEKGFLFTIGDEPNLRLLPSRVINELMDNGHQESYSDVQLLEMAQERYHVYHIHMDSGYRDTATQYWTNLLGDNCIVTRRDADVAEIIKNIVVQNYNPADIETSEGGGIDLGL